MHVPENKSFLKRDTFKLMKSLFSDNGSYNIKQTEEIK